MSNRRKLRPAQVASQDQALARARDLAREYGAVVAVAAGGKGRCAFAEADDSPCFGTVSLVSLRLHGDTRAPAEYPACRAHVLLVVGIVATALRNEGGIGRWGLSVDNRLDGAAAP